MNHRMHLAPNKYLQIRRIGELLAYAVQDVSGYFREEKKKDITFSEQALWWLTTYTAPGLSMLSS